MRIVNGSKQLNVNDDGKFGFDRGRQNCLSEKIPARLVLYFLSWSGFLVSFMLRNDINFALLVMVRDNTTMTNSSTSNNHLYNNLNYSNPNTISKLESYNESELITTPSNYNATVYDNNNNDTQNMTYDDNLEIIENVKQRNSQFDFEYQGEYDWSSTIKATILSSFYWCYVLSQVVGGVATQYFGTKNVFGWSQLVTAVCSLFIPCASDIHYGFVILLRSIQGFASGLTWPAMYALVGYWIPEIERSRFMSSFQGFSIGIGLTYPLCGFIIKHFGWRFVFYTTGTIGCSWCIMWYFLAFDRPESHPRITNSELNYIGKNINNEIRNSQGMKVPWIEIFKSLPAWSIGVTTFGRIWVHYQFIMSGPNYMKNILGFSIQSNGLLSGLPFLCSYIASVLFCYLADFLSTNNWLSLTNVRKLFTAISQILPGLMLLMIGYIDNNVTIVLTIWFIAVTLITAAYAGAMANIVDIAPNLAGPVLAFAQTIHMSASFLSPFITGFIVINEKSITQWRSVFGLSLGVALCTYIMFQVFGTADIQPWNYPRNKSPNEDKGILQTSQLDEKISDELTNNISSQDDDEDDDEKIQFPVTEDTDDGDFDDVHPRLYRNDK